MKNVFIKTVIPTLLVLLLFLLPFGCSQLVEDHHCCVKEREEENKRNLELTQVNGRLGSAKSAVGLSIENLYSRTGNLLDEIRFYITRPATPQRLNLLMQNIRQYNDAITRVNTDLDTLDKRMHAKWTAKEALDEATVKLLACIRADCPPVDDCCPAEKMAYDIAVLALPRQNIKVVDINSYLSTIKGIQSHALSDSAAVNSLYARECSLSNAARCNDAKSRVNLNVFLNQITGRVNQAKKDSTDLKNAIPNLVADSTRTKNAMDVCIAGCPK